MPGSVIAYTGNDVAINNILLNTIDAGCIWTVEDIDGWWGLPEATAPDSPRSVYEDGSTPVAGRYLSRKLKIKGTIVPTEPNTDGQAFSVAARNAFNRALNLIRTQGVLQVNGDPAKMAYVQVVDRPLTNMSKQNDVLNFEISLRASDPRKYDISETTLSTTAYLGNIGRTYDKVYDYTYGTEGSSGLINAYNEGTYNTFGKIVIHGPVVNPTIEHLSSNSILSFDITLAVGQSLEIDLAVHTVTLNGANRRTALLPISKWFSLQPGDNFIKFSGTQDPLPQSATEDRTNLISYPNATGGTAAGWVHKVAGQTISVTTVAGFPGDNVYLASATSSSGFANRNWGFETAATARPSVSEFNIYAFSIDVRNLHVSLQTADLGSYMLTTSIDYYDFNGVLLKTHESVGQEIFTHKWNRISVVSQAPSGATKVSIRVGAVQYSMDDATFISEGVLFDDAILELVATQDELHENIVKNGNLTKISTGWLMTDPQAVGGTTPISIYNHVDYDITTGPSNTDDYRRDTLDWYLYNTAESGSSSDLRRTGFQYTIDGGFIIGEEYAFGVDVRSTIDQNWGLKVQAITSGGVAITGAEGNFITKGGSQFVGANEWSRITSKAVVPSGTASLRVIIAPSEGTVYAINAILNPSFERAATDELAYAAYTLVDENIEPYISTSFKNYAVSPDGQPSRLSSSPTEWAVGSFGTAGAGTLTYQLAGGYVGGSGRSVRKTWTTAPSSPATQGNLGLTYTTVIDAIDSPWFSMRAWVNANKTANQQLRIEFLNSSSSVVSTWTGLPTSITTAGGWLEAQSLNVSAFNPYYARVYIGPFAAGFTPAIADWISSSAVQIERAQTLQPYFYWGTKNTVDYTYSSNGNGYSIKTPSAKTVTRTNRATNPRPLLSTTNWSFQNGTTGAATLSTVTNEAGPTDQLGFRRATITTADTAGNTGHIYQQDGTETGAIGDRYMASIWVRSSVAYTIQLSQQFRNAGGLVGSGTFGTPTLLVPNVWTRLSVAVTSTTAYDGWRVWAQESTAGSPPVGAIIDATSVLFEPAPKGTTYTNEVLDPSFETTTGTSVVKTNFAYDPFATAYGTTAGQLRMNNTRWFGSAPAAGAYTSVSSAIDGPLPGVTTYARKTWTTAPAAIGNSGDTGFQLGSTTGTQRWAVVPGQRWTVSAYVRPSVQRNVNAVIYQYNSSGTAFTTPKNDGAVVSAPAGVWTRISHTYTVPTGVAEITVIFDSTSSSANGAVNWAVGSTFDCTAILIERSTTLSGFYAGTTRFGNRINLAQDPDTVTNSTSLIALNTGRWTSESTNTLVNAPGTGPIPGLDTFVRRTFIATTTPGGRGFSVGNLNPENASPTTTTALTVVPNQTYTLSAYMRTAGAGQNAVIRYRWAEPVANNWIGAIAATTNTPIGNGQWTRVSATITAPAGAGRLAIIFDLSAGPNWTVGQTLDATGLLIEQNVNIVSSFFSGRHAPRTYQNFLQNPSSESSSGTTVVRTNINPNPSFETNTTGWAHSGAGSSSRVNTGAKFGSWSVRAIGGNLYNSGDFRSSGGGATQFPMGMVPGGTYTVSAFVTYDADQLGFLTTAASRQRRILYFYSINGSTFTESFGPQVSALAGSYRLSHTFTIPANATGIIVAVGVAGAATGVGVNQYIDGILVENHGQLLPYFDGSIIDAIDPDVTPGWTGTAHGSTSTLTAANVAGVMTTFPERARQYRSSQWAWTGTNSLRITPLLGASYAAVSASQLTVGQTYTIIGRRRITAPLSGTSDANYTDGKFVVTAPVNPTVTMTATAPNTAGTAVCRGTFVANENTHEIRLGHGYTVGDVWWDDVAVIEGVYVGNFFDGNTPLNNLDTVWDGTPNLSRTSAYDFDNTGVWTGAVDGSTSFTGNPELIAAWAGTANASYTNLSGAKPTEMVSGVNATAYATSSWAASGVRSIRVMPNSESTDSYVVVAPEVSAAVLAWAQTLPQFDYAKWQFGATIRQRGAAIGSTFNRATLEVVVTRLSGTQTYRSNSVQNSAAATPVYVSVNLFSSKDYDAPLAIEIRLRAGTTIEDGDVWFDNLYAVVDPNTSYRDLNSERVDYFDGNTSNTANNIYSWLGAANASKSVTYFYSTPTIQSYFDGDTAQYDELSRNLVMNASPYVNNTNWSMAAGTGGVGNVAWNSGAGAETNGFVRATWTTGTSVASGSVFNNGVIDVKPSTVYSGGIWVRPSKNVNLAACIQFRTSSGTNDTLSPDGPTTYCPAGKWTRVAVENVTSGSNSYAGILTIRMLAVVATNDYFDLDQAMVVAGSTLPKFFDGTTVNTDNTYGVYVNGALSPSILRKSGDAQYWWTNGTQLASPSVESYTNTEYSWGIDATILPHNLVVSPSVKYQNNATRTTSHLVPTLSTNETWLDYGLTGITPVPGDASSFTVYATVVVDKIQSGSLHPSARRFALTFSPSANEIETLAISDQIPNVPGRYTIKWSSSDYPNNRTPQNLRFYVGSSQGNGDVWVERISIVPGASYEYNDPYLATQSSIEMYQGETNLARELTGIIRTGVTEIARNNVENPRFASTNGLPAGATRTNLFSDPRGTSPSAASSLSNAMQSGWYGTSNSFIFNPGANPIHTISPQNADGPEGRAEFLRVSVVSGQDPRLYAEKGPTVTQTANNISVDEKLVHTASVWVRVSTADYVSLSALAWIDGATNGSVTSGPQFLPANVWTRLAVSFTPSVTNNVDQGVGIDRVTLDVMFSSGNSVAASTYDVGSALLEVADSALPYFDGNTPSTADYLHGWLGATNASQSVEVAGQYSAVRRNLLQSPTTYGQIGDAAATTQWQALSTGGGTAAFGFKPGIADQVLIFTVAATGTNSVTISTRKTADPAIPVVPFTEYAYSVDTVSTVALPNGTQAAIQWLDKNGTVITTSNGAVTALTTPNVYTRRSMLAVAPSGARFARPLVTFFNVGTTAAIGVGLGGTNALFERANYVDTFFSGSTPTSSTGLYSAAWDGVRNASSSSLLDLRRSVVRTNYAREALPLSTASTRWTFTPGGAGTATKTISADTAGPDNVYGWYSSQIGTGTGGVPSVYAYTEGVSGVAGDTFTGSMWFRSNIATAGVSGTVNASLTFKLAGVTVTTATTPVTVFYKTWTRVFTPTVVATGAYDEIVIALSTTMGGSSGNYLLATQVLLEKTAQQLPWFDANNPAKMYDRINEFTNSSFEDNNVFFHAEVHNKASNSGPFNTLAGIGTWSGLPPLGATVSTQLVSSDGDAPVYGAPNYVRNAYSTVASVTGDKGIQYLNAQTSTIIGTGTYLIDMYVRSNSALPARLVATSENASAVVVATSAAVSAINLVPNQWTRLRTTLVATSAFSQIRVKAVVGDAATSIPVGATFDASSVLIATQATGRYREYADKLLPDSDWRVQEDPFQGDTSILTNWYTQLVKKNLVLDPTLQYGATDWMLTPGWGTGGSGTRTVELGKGQYNGYSLMRRWTVTPSNSTSVSGIGSGYLFRAATTGTPYSFTALYSASKASSADAWVTWYTDATLATSVQTTLLSTAEYPVSGDAVFLRGEGVIAPATAGFGLFTVGAYSTGFNPEAGDWTSVSNMRIEEGTFLDGEYFDQYSTTGTDNRYQIDGQPGFARTVEMAAAPYSTSGGIGISSLDKSWSSTGLRSLRITPQSTTSSDTFVRLLGADSQADIVKSLPYAQTYTISGTVRVGSAGHKGILDPAARSIKVVYYDQSGTIQPAITSIAGSVSADSSTRVSVTATIPPYSQSVDIRLYNGGRTGAGDIWWDDVLVEQTGAVDDYFDGYSTNLPVGKAASWAGTPWRSLSLIQNIVSDYIGVSSVDGSYLVGTRPSFTEPYAGTSATQALRGASVAPSSYVRIANFYSSSNDTYATVGGGTGALRLGMQAGRTYTMIGTVMLETVQTGTLHANARTLTVYYKTASNPSTYQSFVSSQAPNATGSYEVRGFFTLPTDTTEAYLALYSGSAGGQDRLYWTNVALVPNAYTGPYFDGSTGAQSADEQAGWTGLIDASASALTGVYPSQVYAYNSKPVRSGTWSSAGSYSLKLIPNGSEDSYIVSRTPIDYLQSQYQFVSDPNVPQSSTAITVMATIHLDAAQTGTLSPYARSIVAVDTDNVFTILAQAPNASGTYELVGSLPGMTDLREIRLYNGSTGVSGAPVWWENYGVFYVPLESRQIGVPAYVGPYFDGSTPEISDVQYAWLGEPGNSYSQAYDVGAGIVWPVGTYYYVDKLSAVAQDASGGYHTDFFDGRTIATDSEVYYYTGADETSTSIVQKTNKPAVDTYFDGNTAGAHWNGATNGSTSTLPGLPEIPEAIMDITYRSAWIE